jgi:ribosomal protein S18 acetylase RimI-like enzyme
MRIERVENASDELQDAFAKLVPQINPAYSPPSRTELNDLVDSAAATLLIARTDDGNIAGVLVLTVYRVLTGVRSIIEDMVVDESARRQGIGEALVGRALEVAKERGAAQVTLTSNPKREAANRLYSRIGFKRRETNAYIYKFLERRL